MTDNKDKQQLHGSVVYSPTPAAERSEDEVNLAPNDQEILEGMIKQMNVSTERANAALDDALQFVAESEQRLRSRYRQMNVLVETPKDASERLEDPEIQAWLNLKPVGREIL